ncbi:MAG: glycosyltransferase [Verrucomicrobiota bacterium JB022]|nr:glycosyltransferase [Verrucomicrobiota bacterium JB022]
MRLLHAIPRLDPALGGTVEAVRRLGLALQELGVEQVVATVDDPQADYLPAFPLPVQALGPATNFYGHSRAFQPWLAAHAAEFDAVMVHGLWQYPSLIAWQVCGKEVPYYVFPHGMLDPWFNRRYPLKYLKKLPYWTLIERAVLNQAKGVLYTAEAERELARRSFPRYRPRELVCGLGTATPTGDPKAEQAAFLERFPQLAGRPFLLFLGRLCAKKGVDLLAEAHAERADWPFDLVLAGPGEDEPFAADIRQRFPAERIHWIGPIAGDAKWGALRQAEALILPSHQENFGLVVAEALAVSTPVLLTRQVNIWREVVDAGAGLAEADTLEGTRRLLTHWRDLLEAERARWGENALACFTEHFRMEATAQRLLSILQHDLSAT